MAILGALLYLRQLHYDLSGPSAERERRYIILKGKQIPHLALLHPHTAVMNLLGELKSLSENEDAAEPETEPMKHLRHKAFKQLLDVPRWDEQSCVCVTSWLMLLSRGGALEVEACK